MPDRSVPRYLLPLLATALILCVGRQLWAESPKVDYSALEALALEELKTTNTPGAAIAVVSGDRVLFAKGLGVSSIETGTPVTTDMLFRLGSTTKMFTAAALVKLAEEGKIKLGEPTGSYVKGLSPKLSSVTCHQLLSHTAGIRDETAWYGSHDDAALASSVRSLTDAYCVDEPGKRYTYSNPGYWLAGSVVEEIGGKPFADQMSELLFVPLGMKRTTLRPTMAMTYPLAQGHHAARQGAPAVVRPAADNAATWPAGSIFSSADDLSRFVIAFVNGGKIGANQVLPPALVAQLSSPHAAIPNSKDSYGYGLRIREERGVRVLEHGGNRLGYGSLIRMVPEHRWGIIILTNRTGVGLKKTADWSLELLLASKQ